MLCLKSGYTNIFPQVVDFITRQGRMKYIRPLYRYVRKSVAPPHSCFNLSIMRYNNRTLTEQNFLCACVCVCASRSLFACGDQGKALALKTFASFRSFYHGMAASQLEKDLQLKTV